MFHELLHSFSYLIEKNSFLEKNIGKEEDRAVDRADKAAGQLGEPLRRQYMGAEIRDAGSVTDFSNRQKYFVRR